MEENIENIRRNAISDIKEKIKKNPKYLHPCSKEFREDIKRYKFDNGNKFIYWMQNNGIMRNSTKVKQEYDDRLAIEKGFKNEAERYREHYREYKREWVKNNRWNNGDCIPMVERKDCTNYLGMNIGENLTKSVLIEKFGGIEKEMPPFYSGYEFVVNGGIKVDVKTSQLSEKLNCFGFNIRHNNDTDYFLLIVFDNIDNIESSIHIFLIHKDEMIIYGIRKDLVKFWDRDMFYLYPKQLKEFSKYELTYRLKRLNEYIKNLKEEIE